MQAFQETCTRDREPPAHRLEDPGHRPSGHACVMGEDGSKKERWISLFDGKNLDGWKVKIKGHDLGDPVSISASFPVGFTSRCA